MLAAALALPLLAGCSDDFKRAVGWERGSPDEFQTVQHAPLEQPPDYYLRPPTPGAARPQDAPTGTAEALLGAPRQQPLQGLSAGENALLDQAGADKAPPDIRATVDAATTAIVEAKPSLTDKLLFWRSAQPQNDPTIDPSEEAKRLKQQASNPPSIVRQ